MSAMLALKQRHRSDSRMPPALHRPQGPLVRWRLAPWAMLLALLGAVAGPAPSWASAERLQQGDEARKAGRFPEAARLYEEAVASFRAQGADKAHETLSAQDRLALTLGDLGRYAEQLALAEEVLKRRKELDGPRSPHTLTAMGNLGLAYFYSGRIDDQVAMAEKVLELRTQADGARDPKTLLAMGNLAQAYSMAGRIREAVALDERTLGLSTGINGERHPDTLRAMNNLASSYGRAGRNAERLALNERLLGLVREVLGERHPNTLVVMNNLALTYGLLGRAEEQLALTEQTLALRREVLGERHPETLITQGNLALALAQLERREEALDLDRRTLQMYVEVLGERHPQTINSRNNLETSGFQLGRFAEYLEHNRRTLQLRREVQGEKHPGTLFAMANLGYALTRTGQLDEALSVNMQVLALRQEVLGDRHPDTLNSIGNLVGTLLELGRTRDAAALSGRYVDGAEHLRAQPGLSAETRRSLFETYARQYRSFGRLHADLGNVAEGFRLAELGKARTLLESMAVQRAARAGVLPAAEQEALEDLGRRIAALEQSVARARSAEARQNFELTRNELARQHDALQTRLRERFPKFAQLGDVRLVQAAELPGLVPEGAIAVSYQHAGDQLDAYLVEPTGRLHWVYLGRHPGLADAVDIWRRAHATARPAAQAFPAGSPQPVRLADGSFRLLEPRAALPAGAPRVIDFSEVGAWLSQRLLVPLASHLRGRTRWIVSPDGPLAQLPFEALPFGDGQRPALATAEIHYTQSLSVFAASRALQSSYRGLQGRQDLFAMGNAQYEDQRTPGERGAPGTERLRGMRLRDASQLRELDGLWPDLPGTEAEVRSVAALFGGSASVHLAEQATEQRLQALNAQGALRRYRYLLLAAHGYLSTDQPALSSVVLGLQQRTPEADGYVTAAEWPAYDLQSELTVLSACDSGVGKVVGGEGVMGLPFALFVAGNVNTLLTLWPVADRATAEFVTAYFRRLKAGADATRALADTKREFAAHRRWGHPAFWAAFVLVGAG